ncbi:MAG TPA: glycoside hydrolase family 3 N-terminal domain-containing protein [Actinomycetota bacterium]
MLAFEGTTLADDVRALFAETHAAGVTLFAPDNVRTIGQVRELCEGLQALGGVRGPLLIAIDQEGGQLLGLGKESTPFAGNMALGAAGDEELAERVGAAVGRELRAAGVNVNYAPVADVATDPGNPSLGIRSFGDDPAAVGRLAAATVRGLRSAGVAATLKHFPGKGDAAVDPHHEIPLLDLDRDRLRAVELPPFRAGIEAGADLVMIGHYDVPKVTGRPGLPSSLSEAIVTDVLREQLGFGGVVISDALDMGALPQDDLRSIDALAALRAGVDLLLLTADPSLREGIRDGLRRAEQRELLDPQASEASDRCIEALRRWLASFDDPPLTVVGSDGHRALARELAERSVTLVRDDAGALPLSPDARIAAVMPAPRDLTPADSSSAVTAGLEPALRRHADRVDGFVTGHPPEAEEIASLRGRARDYDAIVVGTIDAFRDPRQADLVAALVETGVPVVAVALRTPFDLAAYPGAPTYTCTYGILAPSLEALADAVFGRRPFRGRLPAAIPGLYPTGHGIVS